MLVLLIRTLNTVDHLPEPIGHRVVRLHDARRLRTAAAIGKHDCSPHLDTTRGHRFEADKRPCLLHLQNNFFRQRFRQACRCAVGAGREHGVVITVERHLARTALSPQHAQLGNQLSFVGHREALRSQLCRLQVTALLELKRSPAQRQGIVEAIFDLHVEPAVNATIDKLRREVKDDDKRQHRKPDEHAHHACLEFCAGYVLAIVTKQARQVANKQCEQQYAADNIGPQDNFLHAIEVGRLLHRLRKQEQRRQDHADTQRRDHNIEGSF